MASPSRSNPFSTRVMSSNLSSNFKGVSRQSSATWGNRFVRDHNDLVYDADINSIGRKLTAKNRAKQGKKKTINPEEEA